MFLELLIASVAIMLASLIGVVTLWKTAGRFVEHNLSLLISFAAGVFIVLAYGLLNEVLTEAESIGQGILWVLGGLVLVTILVKIIPHSHHHSPDNQSGRKLDARRLLIGDSLHNIGDGILLAATYIANPALGFATALSLFVHELVQEVSEFFILRESGYSSKGALTINFLTASTILVGSIGGYFLITSFSMIEIPVLGLATGALIALLIQDLIPHSIERARTHKCFHKHILSVILGILVMFSVGLVTNDTHTHDHGAEIHEEEHPEDEHHDDHHDDDHDHEEHG